jgi:hypothetical protein
MVAGTAFTVLMLSTSWPQGTWRLDLGVAVTLGVCAFLRRVHLGAAMLAGLSVAAAAAVVADLFDLPQEPGPITGFALAVLLGACLRRGGPPLVVASLLGSACVVALTWFTARPQEAGFTAVTVLLMVNLVGATIWGSVGRMSDAPAGSRTR